MQSMLVNLVNDRFFLSVFRKDLCATFLKLYICTFRAYDISKVRYSV